MGYGVRVWAYRGLGSWGDVRPGGGGGFAVALVFWGGSRSDGVLGLGSRRGCAGFVF